MDYEHQQTASFLPIDDIIDQIKDGSTIALGGLWFVRLPMGFVEALVKKGVKDLTVITQVSGLPIEQLIAAKLVKKVIFSFASLDIFGLPPYFRRAIEEGAIEWEEWNALRMNQALEAGRQGLPSMVLQPPYGSDFMKETDDFTIQQCPFSGTQLGVVRAFQPDVALIHAQRADARGNVQIQGALGIDRLLIGASKQTFVSVEEIVPEGKLEADCRSMIIPRFLVNAICRVKGGAYPSSCLPYYITDYWQLSRVVKHAKEQGYSRLRNPDEESLEDRLIFLKRFTEIDAGTFEERAAVLRSERSMDENSYSIDELMACAMAAELQNEMVSTVGSNTPLSMAAYLLAKQTHAPDAVLIPYTGLNDIPVFPITISLSEVFAFQNSSSHWAIEDLWQWIYQKSLTAIEFGSPAQLDSAGRINNSIIGPPERMKVRLPGQGGLADVLNLHHHCYLYLTRQDHRRMVETADFFSGARALLTDEERKKAGLPVGKYKLFTNLGVFELNHDTRAFTLISIHPGVTVEEIRENTGFDISISDKLATTAEPTREQLKLLRNKIDPFSFRKLEFASATERRKLIASMLDQEQQLLFGRSILAIET